MPPKKLNLPAIVTTLEYSDDKKQIRNPKTGKWVKVDGDTGMALLALLTKHHQSKNNKEIKEKPNPTKEIKEVKEKKIPARVSAALVKDVTQASKVSVARSTMDIELGSQYEDWRELGRGAFGVTFSAKTKDRTVVLKRLVKHGHSPAHTEQLKRQFGIEAFILKQVAGECKDYLVCYVDMKETYKYYYIIMEFLGTFREMESVIDKQPPLAISSELARKVIRNLLGGLKTLQLVDVVHRDIKPANIMMDVKTGQIKIIDFGLSRTRNGIGLDGVVGSPDYIDPEITTKTENHDYEEITYNDWIKADMWSMGLTIFEFLTRTMFNHAFFNSHLDEIEAVAFKDEKKVTFDAQHPDLRMQDVLLARYLTERGKDGHEDVDEQWVLNAFRQQKHLSPKDVYDFYQVFAGLTNLDPSKRKIVDL